MIALTVLAATALTTLAGCPGAFGCGGYTGGADSVYQRGSNDVVILCGNQTFVERLDGQAEVDGFAISDATDSDIVHGTIDNTAAVAFTLTQDFATSTATAPELGSGAFQLVTLDQVSLDHANDMCTRLATQTWFTASPQQ
nr:hypothetical protein [Kofleriaceae bacterium]